MSRVVFFDIDGTLLTTGRAGVTAVEDAAEEVCGVRPELAGMKTAGLTDGEIAARVVESCGGEGKVDELLRAYERRLPDRLGLRRGTVLPGVIDLLEDLRAREDVSCLLLTGNTAAGARAKLRHYGLDGYFDDGAFCLGHEERERVAARARELATRHLGRAPEPEAFYVVGDTPADVRCGRSVGARTVAVASGDYSLDELSACEPWHALAALPAPEGFAALIGAG